MLLQLFFHVLTSSVTIASRLRNVRDIPDKIPQYRTELF